MTDATEDTTDIYVGGIPKKVKPEALLALFKDFDCTIDHYKVRPYAFLKCPKDKVEALLAKEIKIGDEVLEVNVAKEEVPVIRYFMDSRMSNGALNELTEEQITEYFSKFGEVVKLNIVEGKGFGFINMKKDDDNEEVSGLAWRTHDIEGHTINVKEQGPRRRRRKGRGNKRKRGNKGWKKNKKNKN